MATLAALSPDACSSGRCGTRAVVRSYLEGRGRRWADRYPTADALFEARTARDPWSVRRLSEAILERDRVAVSGPLTDVERVVVVWAEVVRTTEIEGPRHFGDRALRVRHEDFCADPAAVLDSLFERMGAAPTPRRCAGAVGWSSRRRCGPTRPTPVGVTVRAAGRGRARGRARVPLTRAGHPRPTGRACPCRAPIRAAAGWPARRRRART
ncbi:MAG: hypothetical protein R2695_01195 [Acidimicrobiales bacterium]